jgi:hypothetical protein
MRSFQSIEKFPVQLIDKNNPVHRDRLRSFHESKITVATNPLRSAGNSFHTQVLPSKAAPKRFARIEVKKLGGQAAETPGNK